MRVGERDALVLLREIAAGMQADLLERLRSGKIDARNVESQGRSRYRSHKKARGQVAEMLARVGAIGAVDVKMELDRQEEPDASAA